MSRLLVSGGARVAYHPEFEERSAASYSHIAWQDYVTLPMQERASIIAFYRSSHALQTALEQRRDRASRAKSSKSKPR